MTFVLNGRRGGGGVNVGGTSTGTGSKLSNPFSGLRGLYDPDSDPPPDTGSTDQSFNLDNALSTVSEISGAINDAVQSGQGLGDILTTIIDAITGNNGIKHHPHWTEDSAHWGDGIKDWFDNCNQTSWAFETWCRGNHEAAFDDLRAMKIALAEYRYIANPTEPPILPGSCSFVPVLTEQYYNSIGLDYTRMTYAGTVPGYASMPWNWYIAKNRVLYPGEYGYAGPFTNGHDLGLWLIDVQGGNELVPPYGPGVPWETYTNESGQDIPGGSSQAQDDVANGDLSIGEGSGSGSGHGGGSGGGSGSGSGSGGKGGPKEGGIGGMGLLLALGAAVVLSSRK